MSWSSEVRLRPRRGAPRREAETGREGDRRDGGRGEVGGGRQAAPHGGDEFGRGHHTDPGPVGGEFLGKSLGVAVRHAEAVAAGVGQSGAGFRYGAGEGAFAEPVQPAGLDIHDGGPDRQLRQPGQLGPHVEVRRRGEALLLQDGHGGREAGEAEEALVPAGPVVGHEVPLAEAAAEAPRFHQPLLFLAGAAGEVAEADGVLGVHGRNEVLEGLAGGPDPRLDSGGEFGVGQSAGGLELAHRVDGRGAEGGVLPELGREDEHGALGRGEARRPEAGWIPCRSGSAWWPGHPIPSPCP